MKLVVFFVVIIFICVVLSYEHSFTVKQSKILSRKKRFLRFPEGSMTFMTVSGLKEILLQVPKGFRTLVECDVFFKLPSGPHRSYLKKLSMHYQHRREIYDKVTDAINMFGMNGDACIKQMICEAQYLSPFRENSLFQQLLFTIFINPTSQNITMEYCNKNTFSDCSVSLLGLILNNIYN